MQKMQVVRYKSGKHSFEIGCKPGAPMQYRAGKLGINNVLETDVVWKDLNKGDRASAADLKEVFRTDNQLECIQRILDEGQIQLTDAERKEALEMRRREIVTYLHKYYVDPKTKYPHPVTRIENALVEIKYRVDPDLPVEKQVTEIMRNLPTVLPVKKQEMVGFITIPHAHLGQAQGQLKKLATVKHERYIDAGCEFEVAIVPGDYEALLSTLSSACKGEFEIKIEGAPTSPPPSTSDDGGKGKKQRGGKQGGGEGRGGKQGGGQGRGGGKQGEKQTDGAAAADGEGESGGGSGAAQRGGKGKKQ